MMTAALHGEQGNVNNTSKRYQGAPLELPQLKQAITLEKRGQHLANLSERLPNIIMGFWLPNLSMGACFMGKHLVPIVLLNLN